MKLKPTGLRNLQITSGEFRVKGDMKVQVVNHLRSWLFCLFSNQILLQEPVPQLINHNAL